MPAVNGWEARADVGDCQITYSKRISVTGFWLLAGSIGGGNSLLQVSFGSGIGGFGRDIIADVKDYQQK